MTFPFYFYLGSFKIHPHIIFESIAYAVSFRLVLRNVRKDSIKPSDSLRDSFASRTSVIVGGMVGALVGAKLLVWLQHIDLLRQNPEQFLLLLLQGKTVVGALLGGLIGVEITKKIIGVTKSTGDAFVYPLIVGTAIGRIGCFLTGLSDKTYGVATTLPWGVDFGDGIHRHPTQIYEIIFLISLILFLNIRRQYLYQEGDLFKFYLIAYLGFRFLVDFIKPDFRPLVGLSAIQIACLIAIFYYYRSLPAFVKFTRAVNRGF
jgi:phosphatidylglycerol---prolipoprotein diacylglyceryl transferase